VVSSRLVYSHAIEERDRAAAAAVIGRVLGLLARPAELGPRHRAG